MSKVLGLFVFKYAKPYIPLEIQSMIVKYLRSTQLEYLATKNPGEWCEKAKFSKEFRNSVVWKIIFDKPPIDKLYNLDIDWYKFSKYTIPVEFIEDNPDKNWDWFVLTRKIGLRFIKEHIDYNWDWRHMMHKNVSNDFIIKHKDKPWNWLDMWVYICVDEKLLSATIEKNWNWYYITKSVSIEFILAHDKNWDWELATKKVVNIKHFELDKPWDWHEIKNVTGEFVECHVDKSWNFYKLLRLEIIDYHFIDKHPEIDWYWKTLSYCKITPEFVDKYSEKNWDWEYYLSRNENISEWLVEIYIHKPWDWKELARNPAISPQFLVDYVVDFKFISNNPNLTEEFIEKYIDEDWNWGKLNVSFEFIDKYPDKSWIWKNLHNKNPPNKFIEKYINKNWSFYHIHRCELVKKHIWKEWDWDMIFQNCTLEFFNRFQHWETTRLKWDSLSSNPNLTMEYIEKNIDKDWNWLDLSKYLRLDIEFVKKYQDKLELSNLLQNKSLSTKDKLIACNLCK